MTTEDKYNLSRTAQRCIAEFRRSGDDGFDLKWQPIFEAQVLTVTHNANAEPNRAYVRFPDYRWTQAPQGVLWGDQVRIRTDQATRGDGTPYTNQARAVLFQGFVTSFRPSFSGGSEKGGSFEHNDILCADHRWLLNSTSPIYGQMSRGIDDYTSFGTDTQAAITNRSTFMSGRRCIFNESGRPNRDPVNLDFSHYPDYPGSDGSYPIFAPPRHTFADGSRSQYWTARQMMQYIFSPFYNRSYKIFPINPLADVGLAGLTHDDWDAVLNHVVVDGLGMIDAAEAVCRHLGWSFREQYSDSGPTLRFYKVGAARSQNSPTILHNLHAPAPEENISSAVADGRKMCCDAEMIEDLAAIVNNPLGLGAPYRFEFTAELVPAWADSDLVPDAGNLFFSESDLLANTNPNQYSFYNKYHTRGAAFLRDVGRKWALNESGKYTGSATGDRGPVFDFATVLDAVDVQHTDGRRTFMKLRTRYHGPGNGLRLD